MKINMEKQVDKKIVWVTKNFPSMHSKTTSSNQFLFGGCKCRFVAFRKESNDDYLSLCLEVVGYRLFPEYGRQTKFSFTIVNQVTKRLFEQPEPQQLRIGNDNNPKLVPLYSMYPLGEFKANNGSILVNGEVNFGAKFGILQVVGKLDLPEESKETTNPVKRIKLNDNGVVSTDLQKETMDVNGVQVLRSQVEFVSRLFEKLPDIALVFRSMNPHLRTGYMNVLLSLTQKLGQSPRELSNGDLSDTDIALTYMKEARVKMDWLEKALEEVKEKKKKEEACLVRLHEKEEELKPLKQKCLELEAHVDKENAELLEARAPFSFDLYLSS